MTLARGAISWRDFGPRVIAKIALHLRYHSDPIFHDMFHSSSFANSNMSASVAPISFYPPSSFMEPTFSSPPSAHVMRSPSRRFRFKAVTAKGPSLSNHAGAMRWSSRFSRDPKQGEKEGDRRRREFLNKVKDQREDQRFGARQDQVGGAVCARDATTQQATDDLA